MEDERFMQIALNLARETTGQTTPNPVVGAVIVKNEEIIGIGAHLKSGGKHAEVHAIDMAGNNVKDAILYVTLEPCSHQGKTPPCTDLIINSGIRRVVIATEDPNNKVNGIEILKAAGIEVKKGVLEKKAKRLNTPFFHFIRNKRPYVTLKTASTFDGKIATKTGESKWISSQEARCDAHMYRHTHDAILVGVNTVIADNPRLTTRLKNEDGRNPIRVILDTHLRTPSDANVITDREAETWIFVGNKVTEKAKRLYIWHEQVTIIQLESETISIRKVLDELGKRNITSLFVEGGSSVNGSFLRERLFNQFIVYLAPKLIGGHNAPSTFTGTGFAILAESPVLTIDQVEQLGADLKIVATYEKEEEYVYRDY
ncbi:MAG TPA: bifunctional diaminohydroxyphosphoribosylaminopyrimidine deaminase/5-amino-6-(5-phosphoribosylamino)uracil reductase RibD [Candidatus Avamphibacillus sp.]|nr:bifunctional diaminohydroxyphosphoribosylaminopyrimidine deaminase/5-amino-6-(5-phosphoribosylamino)uracil reductase RibD [Candidatus Avamphibacillus sp.]